MISKATTVAAYLAELPADRRAAISAVRDAILKNLDADYEEGMSYGMICYCVPHRVFPAGYHCDPKQPLPFVALASQKNYMSLYMMSGWGEHEPENEHARWFREAWLATGKKLDRGKSCIRFKTVDALPLAVVGEAVRRLPVKVWIASYEASIAATKAAPRKPTAKKPAKVRKT